MLAIRRVLALLLALPAVVGGGLAQSTSGYRVESFTTENGLPSQSISSIAETSDGFLWIGAGGFLVRFDGHEFRTYTQANTPALKRRVSHLHAGGGDTLWILDQGDAVIAFADGKGVEVVPPSPRPLSRVAWDGNGTLFGVGYHTAWRLGRGTERDQEILPRIPIPSWTRAWLTRDRNGHVWLVDSLHTLRRLDNPGLAAPSTLIDYALLDSGSAGAVLAVRAHGALRDVVRANGDVVISYPAGASLPTMDREGRLWVVDSGGYAIYEHGSATPVATIPPIEAGAVGMLLEGSTGCMWITELSLIKVCRVPFRTIALDMKARKFVARGPAGSVLSWDDRGRVVMITADDQSRPLGANDRALRYARVHLDARGTPWWSAAVDAPASATATSERMLPHRGAYAFADDPSDSSSLWYAAEANVYRAILPAAGPARVIDSIAVGGVVTSMAGARDGTLWVTVNRRDMQSQLVHIVDGKITAYTKGDEFPVAALRAVAVDDDGTVWLGTYGGGLVRLRDGHFRTITEASGLADNVVTSLLQDTSGNIWMGGNRGIHRVARREVRAFLNGAAPRVNGVLYGRADGLTSPETSGYSGVRDDAGRFWFPTLAGAAVVDPSHAIALDRTPPFVHILGLTTQRDTVDGPFGNDAPVQLTRGARRVTLSYAGIANRNSDAVRYEYRIDGLDRDWVDAGHARLATYAAITPGVHTFRVRAINAGGTVSRADAMLQFAVPSYFYETPAFIVLLLLTTGAFGLAAMHYRERRLRRRAIALTQAVEERTGELKTALDTVAAQANQLRTLDEAKSRFFANVSHEFRTPLSLILGPVDDMRTGRFGELPEEARRHLEGVMGNARRLLQLVEQLLELARLESGAIRISTAVHDIVPLLRRLAESFASLAERKGIAFRLSCPVGGMRLQYDPDRMEKVISNLLGNALKFTPAGGNVELCALADPDGDGMAVVEVRDTGPGIAPEHHERIFERFFQVDDSSRRGYEGTGIGLALVRELVELHSGTVVVRSALGEGSTFTVRLPLADGATRATVENVIIRSDRTDHEASALASARPGAESADLTTVLVIEDNVDLLAFLRDHLAERYRVLVAENGVEGLKMAREYVPDLIVSDVMMPRMDGQALCEAVKGDPDIDFIPVILLTAKASRDSRMAGLVGGADDYLTKPVDLDELFIRADNLIASRQRVRERYEALNRQLPTLHVPLKDAPRDASSEALLDRLRTVMHDHLADEDFTADAMAAEMGMGRSTLYRRLEPLLGKPPMDAMWDYRLGQAAQWLVETHITVSEVAYGVGFKSVPHFCGRFRDRYGETPSGYRRAGEPSGGAGDSVPQASTRGASR